MKAYCKVNGELRVYDVLTDSHEYAIHAVTLVESNGAAPIGPVLALITRQEGTGIAGAA